MRRAPFERQDADQSQLFSPSEVYHENSKLHASDQVQTYVISYVNSSPDARSIITKPFTHYHGYPTIDLPRNHNRSKLSVEEALERRRSQHEFGGGAIELPTLSKILHLGDGISSKRHDNDGTVWQLRTAPSPGALYPIDMHVVLFRSIDLAQGLYFYAPQHHQLEQLDQSNHAATLGSATFLHDEMANASACIILSAIMPRIQFKYGQRAYRFALLEAGHIAQNLLLAATIEGLETIPVGGFFDNEVNGLLGLDGCEEIALYLVVLGTPKLPLGI